MSDAPPAVWNNNKPSGSEPASRFLVGVLGTLLVLLALCTIVLTKPYFVRAVRRLETARRQRDAVDRSIEKRRLARRPKLRECWIDFEELEGIKPHDNYGATWAGLQVCLHTSHRNVFR
jgi:hypothetical protein